MHALHYMFYNNALYNSLITSLHSCPIASISNTVVIKSQLLITINNNKRISFHD